MSRIKHIAARTLLPGIFLFALGVRILCRYMEPMLSRDSITYINFTRQWYETGSLAALLDAPNEIAMIPLLMYIMKLLMHLGLSAEAAGITVNMVAGSLLSVLFYYIAVQLRFSKAMAVTAALLAAVEPTLIGYSIEVQRESLYLLFCGLFLWAVLYGVSQAEKITVWGGAGTAAALAFLTRVEGLELIVMAIIFSVADVTRSNIMSRLLARNAVFLISWLVVVALLVSVIGISGQQLVSAIKWRMNFYL